MAGRLKGAAAWLGLVTDDRYDDRYDYRESDNELTEGVDLDGEESAEYEDSVAVDELESRRGSRDSRRDETARTNSSRSSAELPPATQKSRGAVASRDQESPASTEPQQRTADMSRIITVHPRTYNEARTIGEHFRDGVPVIMNLSEMEDADAKRLVDFAAGLIFGLRGSIERITSRVFLISPQNVNVTAEDKERIAGGFFNQS